MPVSRFCGITVLIVCLTVVADAQQPPEPSGAAQGPAQSQVQQPAAQQTVTQEPAARTQAAQAGDQREQTGDSRPVEYALGAMLLVVFVLLVLGYLFWVMILYSNRFAQTGPLGIQITDAFDEVRKQRGLKELAEKQDAGDYYRDVLADETWMSSHAVPAVPQELRGDWQSEFMRRELLQRGRMGSGPPPGLGDANDQHREKRREYVETLRSLADEFESEARRRFLEDQQKLLAPQGSKRGIIKYFDFPSVAGQGPEFVLRFTALVTIIFAVIALSVLNQLDPDHSGTILAAIAGYVLGQASARRERSGAEEPAPASK